MTTEIITKKLLSSKFEIWLTIKNDYEKFIDQENLILNLTIKYGKAKVKYK